MRTDVAAPADPTLVSRAGVTVTLYLDATPRDLIEGTAGLTTRDLTPYAERLSHSATQADVTLRWHTELDGANRPLVGQLVRIALGSSSIFTGHIDGISGDRRSRAESKTCQVTVRRRDASAWWRDVRRASGVYSVGVDLAALARDVALSLGLTASEYLLPDVGITLAHDSAQLSDLNAWDMLELALAPGLKEPLVDARGFLKTSDRNVLRAAEITIPLAQVKDIETSTARPPLTVFRVNWLGPDLSRVDQQYQTLTRGPVTVTVGFFNPSATVEVFWSDDHTQLADHLVLNELQSPQISFWGSSCSSSVTQTTTTSGTLQVEMDVGESMAELMADIIAYAAGNYLEAIPVVGAIVGGSVEAAALGDILRILTQQAFGAYAVEGIPYDMLHAVNETEAYDADAETWRYQFEETRNDLVPNEQVADAYAANELVFRARSASKARLVIADDLRLEQGDMVGLEDGRRFYVEDYSRELGRGAEALLTLEGFFV